MRAGRRVKAATGPQAIELAQAQRPDVLVLDIGLPGMDGIEVARTLRLRLPQVKVLALSIHSEERIVRGMLEAGAAGYVDKSSALSELVRAICLVMEGKLYLSPEVTRGALGADAGAARISARERQVLALLAESKRSLQIAQTLNISIATVEAHRRNIMRKLGLHTVADLTRYALVALFLISTVWQFRMGGRARSFEMSLPWFVPVSFVSGLTSALVGASGVLANPFYLNYGMVKERMLATRAVSSIGIQLAKLAAYGAFGALTLELALHGAAAGAGAVLAVWVTRPWLRRLPSHRFGQLAVLAMFASGVLLLASILRRHW